MRISLFLYFFLLCLLSVFAEGPAIIKTTGHQVFVFTAPDSLSAVIDTLNDDEIIFYEHKENSEWVNIFGRSYPGKDGYIRKSELQDILELSEMRQRALILQILSKLEEVFDSYEHVKIDSDSANRIRVYRELDFCLESVYLPMLYVIPEYFNATSDTSILKPFFNILSANSGSASEMQLCAAALCYWYHPELVITSIQSILDLDEFYTVCSIISSGMELCICSPSAKSEDQSKCEELQRSLEAVYRE